MKHLFHRHHLRAKKITVKTGLRNPVLTVIFFSLFQEMNQKVYNKKRKAAASTKRPPKRNTTIISSFSDEETPLSEETGEEQEEEKQDSFTTQQERKMYNEKKEIMRQGYNNVNFVFYISENIPSSNDDWC